MAIIQTQTTSFKVELPKAIHDLLTDTIKLALYTSSASLDEDTTIYSATYEVTGTGYTAGGNTMTGVTINSSGSTAYIDFADVVWTAAAFTAAGGLIYNSSKANRSIAVISFGNDKTSTTTFTVTMPANTVTAALLRLS